MSCPKRKENESYDDYRARRKKDALDTKRVLRPRQLEEGVYIGSPSQHIINGIKINKGVPYRRGPTHPKVAEAK